MKARGFAPKCNKKARELGRHMAEVAEGGVLREPRLASQ